MIDEQHPLILALDTATPCCTLALTGGTPEKGVVLASLSLNGKVTHSRRLLTSIDWMLSETGTDWSMIDGVAVGLGPGSFTGLRIGMATAKGLAAASAKPLVGISTLDAIACGCRSDRLVCAALDARKKEIYVAFYRSEPKGVVRRIGEISAMSPFRLAEVIDEPVLIVGDGVLTYGEYWQQAMNDRVEFAPLTSHYPSASVVGLQGGQLLVDGHFLDIGSASPLYVRASDAELNLEIKKGRQLGGTR